MTSIRQGFVLDLPALAKLGEQFAAESKFVKLDGGYFVASWTRFLAGGDGVIFVAEDEKDDIIGAIGLVKYEDPASGMKTVTEFFWFVAPESRGSVGVHLYKQGEKWARSQGCDRFIMVHLADLMPEKLTEFYIKNGFNLMETHWVKEF